jgi:hypothetical protein
MRLKLLTTLLALATAALPAFTAPLECYEEPGTMTTTCIQPSSVRMNGDLRASPVFIGGPKSVEPTSFKLVTDCAKNISTLQDRQGKNFGGGRNTDTRALQSLATWLCAVPKPRKDASIRQF